MYVQFTSCVYGVGVIRHGQACADLFKSAGIDLIETQEFSDSEKEELKYCNSFLANVPILKWEIWKHWPGIG